MGVNTGNPSTIYFASFLGNNAFEFYRQVVAYLAEVVGIPAELVTHQSSDEQDQRVDTGKIHAVFTCGLPYVRKADQQPSLLRLIAAPVLASERYWNRPVYFSDIIVRADSPYQNFEDLRGAVFAYNETSSFSGYMFPCYHLYRLGERKAFFIETICSGSHAISLDWVENGRVDAAAIDSVVLDMELAQHPNRSQKLRVVESIGPAPMPPVAASTGLAEDLRYRLKDALLDMHATTSGQKVLELGGVQRFVPVMDSDYNSIRQIIRTLQKAGITELR